MDSPHIKTSPPFLAGVCCVGVRAGLGSRLCPALLGWVVGVCVRLCVCRACPRASWGAACRAGVCRCCRFLFFFSGGGACRVLALWCRSLAVPVSGLVVSVHFPIPSLPGCVAGLFFSVPAWCVSACCGCPFSRFAAAPGLVLPVLAGWSPCSPLGGPVFGAFWAGGLAASCGVGGQFSGCGSFSRPPPPVFLFLGGGSACSSVCPPWAGARTCQPSVWSSGLLLVVAFCLAASRPHGFGGLCIGYAWLYVGLGAPSCRVRFWLCRLGGCARRLRVALG